LKTRILVSVDRFETRVAITEDDRVSECHIERRGRRSVVGHVWKGKVENVLAGMEAAFVDVGLEKAGFLHVDEIVAMGVPKNKRMIADLLKKGDTILVPTAKGSASVDGWTTKSVTGCARSARSSTPEAAGSLCAPRRPV
jgi:ribonuclease G